MMKKKTLILKILGGIILSVVMLMVLATLLFHIPAIQQEIATFATELLSEKLQTRVKIERADISLFGGSVNLYGLEIEDQQQRKMLQMEKLSASMGLMALLRDSIVINDVEISGLNALLTKKTDSVPANYQFVIDAFSKKKPTADSLPPTPEKKHKMTLDMSHVELNRIHVNYDKYDFRLHSATYNGKHIKADSIQATWTAEKKNGPVDNWACIKQLKAEQQGKVFKAELEGLRFRTDNRLPRKNTGKPKRGFFDVGHLDITAHANMTIDATIKDSLKMELTECVAQDSITGMDFRNLTARAVLVKGRLLLNDINVQQGDTKLHIANAEMQLPSKKKGIKLAFQTGTITGRTLLKDIARPFAPVLGKFTLPLNLTLTMSGTDSTLSFRNIRVNTDNKRLTIAAAGDITHLKEKELLDVHFNVNRMNTSGSEAELIIAQFPVKRMMMKQLRRLGNITYTGSFDVLYKKEAFRGLLHTSMGSINFNFYLDENNKYVVGQASTKNLALGRVMDIKKLGNVEASAKFSVDISKPRTAIMRRQKGGKLPIGTVNATVDDCSYMGIHVRRLTADITSDGAVATGNVNQNGKHRDIYFQFSFTNTEDMSKMKITHPGIKFHGLSDEDKKAKEEKKRQKKLQKEEKKRQQEEEERRTGKKKKKFLFF